jgi:hypothetical protein
MAKPDEIPKTNPAEVENLIQQIRGTNLEPSAKQKIERLLRTILILVDLLQRKNTSIKKLRQLIFGKRTERHQTRKAELEEKVEEGCEDEEKPPAKSLQPPKVKQSADENKEKPESRGHGHRALSDYTGAKVVKCPHPSFKIGDACPGLCGGRLYDLKEPTSLLQFTGQPLIEATLWERCEATADAALGVYSHLLRLAAQGEVIYTDDTGVRILSCLKEDGEEKGPKTNTSGIVVKVCEQEIAFYLSGRRHAGENLAQLLTKREAGLKRPFQMSDALASNTSVEKEVTSGYCLIHARRKLYELREDYPTECAVVLDAVSKV